MRTSVRIKRVLGSALGVATATSVMAMWPASAAQRVTRITAPYSAAQHDAHSSCPALNVAPSCQAGSSADRASGRMAAASAVDSGARGTVPGSAESYAEATVNQPLDFGNASAATVTFYVHVERAAVSETKDGHAYAGLEALAACDGCPVTTGGYVSVQRPEDQIVSVTLVRAKGARMATVGLSSEASSTVDCSDFCVTPSGSAAASLQAVLTHVDVQLWGLAVPTRPSLSVPGAHPDRVDGTAEPGMAVQLLDGSRVIADGYADGDGAWSAPIDLAPGRHRLRLRAVGQEGTSISAPCTVQVAA